METLSELQIQKLIKESLSPSINEGDETTCQTKILLSNQKRTTKKYKPPTPIQERLLSMPGSDDENLSILYQHSIICQTSMPYRDPGKDVRLWQRKNGSVMFELQAGRVLDPNINDFVDVGLPFGPKPRLVLYHLNTECIRTQSPIIELENSLTAFVGRTIGLDTNGKNVRVIKEQLNRLAATNFRMGYIKDDRAVTIQSSIIDGLELWSPKDPRQRILWPTTIQFSAKYFESLMQHAVPLNEAAIVRLSHSAMALDIYTWLAQRLHRVNPKKQAFVPWFSIKEHFGPDYSRMVDFRRVFIRTLKQVKVVYPDGRWSLDSKGMYLQNSSPPVLRHLLQIK